MHFPSQATKEGAFSVRMTPDEIAKVKEFDFAHIQSLPDQATIKI